MPGNLNGAVVLYNYLGITLDAKLKWKEHIKKKNQDNKKKPITTMIV